MKKKFSTASGLNLGRFAPRSASPLAQIVQETSIQRGLAAAVHRLARVVQHTEQARRLSALDQLADDLVVEERDRSPGDAFRLVLVLLSLECQRDENLLELLVDVVDAELFESVDVKNLEPVNVQDTQTQHVLGADQVFPDLLGDFLDVEAATSEAGDDFGSDNAATSSPHSLSSFALRCRRSLLVVVALLT